MESEQKRKEEPGEREDARLELEGEETDEFVSAAAEEETCARGELVALREARAQIEALQAELDRTKDNALRALAEADNTRKRALRERDDAGKYAVTGFARDLLAVADNFRRAMDSIPPELRDANEQIKNLIVGIESVEREMLAAFDKHGIKKLEPNDEMFNPNFHEVMFEAPVPGKMAGQIIQLIEPGYMLNDRLLRPARVGVARGDEGPPPEGSRLDTQA